MALRDSTVVPLLLTALATAAAAQSPIVLDSNALGLIHACDALTSINRAFPQARDTLIKSEGARWPAKIAHLERGTWVLFESSWADTTHLWRFSTNSPRFHTRRGYAVGARIGDLIAKGERFTAELAE